MPSVQANYIFTEDGDTRRNQIRPPLRGTDEDTTADAANPRRCEVWQTANNEVANRHFNNDAGAKARNRLAPVFKDSKKQVPNDEDGRD
jgi:hypothetical protein